MIGKGADSLLGIFPRLVNARESCYTQTSLEELHQKLKSEWLGCPATATCEDEVHHALKLPMQYADEVLEYDNINHRAKVNLPDLLRYTEMARFIGEELLVVSYLAKKDQEVNHTRTMFTWDQVLPHNGVALYQAMRSPDRGLCDIHFHLQASTSVFDLNWLSLMNHIKNRKEQFGKLKHPLEPPIVVTKYYNYDDLYQWCILAALIRWELYKKYVKRDIDSFDEGFDKKFEKLIGEKDYHSQHDIYILDYQTCKEGKSSMKAVDGEIVDYAIREDAALADNIYSPFMLFHGERRLLYLFYKDYQNDNLTGRECMYIYLYLLVKSWLRRELLHVNGLPGIASFKEYNHRKTFFTTCVDGTFVGSDLLYVAERYAVQTGMPEGKDGLEVRIMPGDRKTYLEIESKDYLKPLFGLKGVELKRKATQEPTFVVHFSKEKGGLSNKNGKLRGKIHKQAETLMSHLDTMRQKGRISKIVAIDVAGSEMNCRPEVFAHLCRYCRRKGMRQFTYHVGEDFYDLVDGIRAIDEVIRFFRMDKRCRLGHCLALGMDAEKYYQSRHNTVIMPKQILLDNMVWILKFSEEHGIDMSVRLRSFLENMAERLYREIGYSQPYDVDRYYWSMQLRGDEVKMFDAGYADWHATKEDDAISQNLRRDQMAEKLKTEYYTDNNIYRKAFLEKEVLKVPFGFTRLIKKVQKKMIVLVDSKIGCVECNPTSNVRIGHLERYEVLPLYRFAKLSGVSRRKLDAAVSTDDKGLFGTSLSRELSLVAVALMKQRYGENRRRWSDATINAYIKRLAETGVRYRFK